jgi:hypothetical protein
VRLQLLGDFIFFIVALTAGVIVVFDIQVPYSSLAMALSYAVSSTSAFSNFFECIVEVE